MQAPAPIFIVGMTGSGTKLLFDHLARHPLLYGFPHETKVIPYLLRFVHNRDILHDDIQFYRFWERVCTLSAFIQANDGTSPSIPMDWPHHPRNPAYVIDHLIQRFAPAGVWRWCEKTPLYGLHMELLAEVYRNAQFIHVVRDGRACAASAHRRWRNNPYQTIYRWKNVVRETRRQGDALSGRYMEIRYEELLTSTPATLQRVYDFLQVPLAEAVHDTIERTGQGPEESEPSVNETPKCDWLDYFDQEQVETMEVVAGSTLFAMGYDTAYPGSDIDPPARLLMKWRYTDYCRRGLNEAKKVLQSGKKETFKESLRYISDAIRQRSSTHHY